MFFLVDNEKKVIFGWSAKCGCSHIKLIFYFLQTGKLNPKIHTSRDWQSELPNDIENYTTIIITRNPYKRIISGFLEKYRYSSHKRVISSQVKLSELSFSNFVDTLTHTGLTYIDKHHFTPQTSEKFDKKILLSKFIKFYDIGKIDYGFIEKLYNKKIHPDILNKQQGHERKYRVNANKTYKDYIITSYKDHVYNLNIDVLRDCNIDYNGSDIKYFYNEEIREKVYNFYINDFIFFKENGIDYKLDS